MTGQVIRASKATAVRYERDRPGELLHMDVKKIGRIPAGGGWRAHGREMGSTSVRKKTKVGYDYVHSVVDDHSRVAYSEILGDETAATAAFFERAIAELHARGITRIEALMTDNAWTYTHSSRLAQILNDLGIRHVLIKPHCPWQNGKVERFNRTLQDRVSPPPGLHHQRRPITGTCALARATTTFAAATTHSEATRRSAACHQRHDPVRLAGIALGRDPQERRVMR